MAVWHAPSRLIRPEVGVAFRDRAVGGAVVPEGDMGEGFSHGEHGQYESRCPHSSWGLVLGCCDECEGIPGLVLVSGLEAHVSDGCELR